MADTRSLPVPGAPAPLVLVLPDGSRVPIGGALTIGRGEEASVRIADRTVSRLHARIDFGPSGPLLEDAGSRSGTLLDGMPVSEPQPLRAGSEIRLGDVTLAVGSDAPPAPRELQPGAGETIVMPIGATQLGLRPAAAAGMDGGLRPRVRSGWALKRLGAEEGEQRFVLRELRGGGFLRLDAEDAALFELLDGHRSVLELLGEAERAIGPAGPGRLARLLAELGDRGLLDGIDAAASASAPAPAGRLARALKPRQRTYDWVGDLCERAYRRWGHFFFAPLTVTFLVLFALAGLAAFAYLVGARYGTPFVVANRLVLGGAVFIVGRFALVAVHELAHGMALAHYKRRAALGGLRLILIFPYAFVDTSEAYFETRQHRIVISAAGPVSDVSLGALFSFLCAVWPAGSVREVFFQLAFGAYVGAFFNLNPFLDRDGYHILVDVLREPGLRQRARQQFAQRLSGAAPADAGSPVLGRYAIFALIWSILAAAFMIVFSTRYYDRLLLLAPSGVVIAVFAVFWAVLFIPVAITLGLPLWRRLRYGTPEVNRVVRR
jgi:putative peptide zinc metalloprotease protein